MGSLNANCSVSHLPITAGTPIRAFVVAQPEGSDRHLFYSTSLYVPLTTSAAGTYTDDGRIGNCTSLGHFFIGCEYFFPHLNGDIELLLDSTTVENSSTIIQLGKCQTRLAFVREDVYREVMKAADISFSEKEIISDLKEMKTAVKKAKKMIFRNSMPDPSFVHGILPHVGQKTPLSRIFFQNLDDRLYDALRPYKEKLIDMLDKKPADNKETIELAKALLGHLQFNHGLQKLGILWQPSTNLNWKSAPYSLQASFNKAIHGICAKEIKAQKKKPVSKQPQRKPK